MKNSTIECPRPTPPALASWEPATPTKLQREYRVSTASVPPADITTTLAPVHDIPSFGSFISHNQPSSMFAVFSKTKDTSSPAASTPKKDQSKTSPAAGAVTPKNAAAQIDPADGKTKTCNRAKTFETFVEGGKLTADLGVTEAVGSSSDVRRGLGKVRGWFGRRKG
ncbi:hypothetical protein P171DRAFT_482834 [Karstenula rhodostoma CBS 690.94]|uniref:Uncharacterized protein n=1 Tax=Karstenula rhodostoma CBS 690.94 TaxID=1392251 RepID=A0A9P4UES9_9PLEO|nr:hypothetical protein P171DRAFT_482834 [Karstenula rhodostoma CBS 690.94]